MEFVGSTMAHARIVAIDVSEAAKVPGIAGVFTAADVPGDNQFGPVFHDEEVLAARECHHIGQPIVVLAGETREALRAASGGGPDRAGAAARRPDDRGGDRRPPLHRPDATDRAGRRRGRTASEPSTSSRGACAPAARSISTSRPQAAMAIPGESGQITVHSSTQHPSEVQDDRRRWSRPAANQVVCICKRMGGGFGGKEYAGRAPRAAGGPGRRAHRPAGAGRLLQRRGHAGHRQAASVPGRATRSASTRTGGSTRARDSSFTPTAAARPTCRWPCWSGRCSTPTTRTSSRTSKVTGTVCRTNLPSNTAFRGFGGPQGIAAIENIIEDVAAHLGLDALEVPQAELLRRRRPQHHALRPGRREQHAAERCSTSWPRRRDYARRRAEAARSTRHRRTHAPRPGAVAGQVRDLVHAADAQPGQRAGQHLPRRHDPGLAPAGPRWARGSTPRSPRSSPTHFALPIDSVRVMPASTEKNNNTSPTAASASTDLNGTAARPRLRDLERSASPRRPRPTSPRPPSGMPASPPQRAFRARRGFRPPPARPPHPFRELVCVGLRGPRRPRRAGFYATPGVDFNRETGRGNPFLYYTTARPCRKCRSTASPASCRSLRVDILIDIGRPTQPGHRPRPGDRRLRAGDGLGHDRRTALLRGGRAALALAQQLQGPERRATCPRTSGSRSWRTPRIRSTCGQQGGRRAAVRAGAASGPRSSRQ